MTLERMFLAALRDMSTNRAQPHCGTAARLDVHDPLGDTTWANGYAEPGYIDPKRSILFANWNNYPSRLTDILEKAGYAIEWSDEWSTCENCNRAVRTQPDSYSWRRAFVIYNDCDIVCRSCVVDDLDTYEAYLVNNLHTADTFDVDWTSRGFAKFNADHYENGFHPGQNDTPAQVVKHLPAGVDYLFTIPTRGQFDISFDVYTRERKEDN